MTEAHETLKIRVLLTLLKDEKRGHSVSGIARVLGEPTYSISRIITEMEHEGLLRKTSPRTPELTKLGIISAKKFEERFEISMNHLIYEGVDVEDARSDAYRWALHNTDGTMSVIQSTYERYRIKNILRDEPSFSGTTLCKLIKNGSYKFPFVIYRERMVNGNNLSMANSGFEHPCTLIIENGIGTVHLRALTMTMRSPVTGKNLTGKVSSVKYLDMGDYIKAEHFGDIISFPASSLSFINIGTGVGQILHGSVCLKMACSESMKIMPESEAIFTMLI